MNIRQGKIIPFLGGFQVQVQNSMFYITFINVVMLASTFWYTTGYPFAQLHLPWFTFWHLIALGVIGFLLVMILDYKFILPSRQAFISQQSAKHDNPAMQSLLRSEQDIREMKENYKKLLELLEGKK